MQMQDDIVQSAHIEYFEHAGHFEHFSHFEYLGHS